MSKLSRGETIYTLCQWQLDEGIPCSHLPNGSDRDRRIAALLYATCINPLMHKVAKAVT